jgi:hypothetical protein
MKAGESREIRIAAVKLCPMFHQNDTIEKIFPPLSGHGVLRSLLVVSINQQIDIWNDHRSKGRWNSSTSSSSTREFNFPTSTPH